MFRGKFRTHRSRTQSSVILSNRRRLVEKLRHPERGLFVARPAQRTTEVEGSLPATGSLKAIGTWSVRTEWDGCYLGFPSNRGEQGFSAASVANLDGALAPTVIKTSTTPTSQTFPFSFTPR